MDISTYLYRSPTVDTFIQTIIDDLREGQSVIVELPEHIEVEVLSDHVQRQLCSAGIEIIPVEADGQYETPLLAIADALLLSDSEASNLPELLDEYGDWTQNAIVIRGFDRASAKMQQSWMYLFRDWAYVSQGRSSEGHATPVLFTALVADGTSPSRPETNVRLRLHQWICLPSVLEASLLCHLLSREQERGITAWRSHILPALAGNDLDLVRMLWDTSTQPLHELNTQLSRYAQERNWQTLPDTTRNGNTVLGQKWLNHITPMHGMLYALWSVGALQWSPEHGFEYHSALHALWNDQETIKHRYWRGQAQLLLPQLDHLRLRICRYMDHRYGPHWPSKWGYPPSQIGYDEIALHQSTSACEWGHLNWIMQCSDVNIRQEIRQLVRKARDTRNNVAHHKIISYPDYQQLQQLAMQADAVL